ncbi:granzyme B(G,H)-like [Spinachia spinachia]
MFPTHRLLLVALGLTLHGRVDTGRIIGGHKAAAHSRPYMALLELAQADGNTAYCGGFLLREDFVMTAAHCQASNYTVYLGLQSYRQKDKAQKLNAATAYPHGDYDNKIFQNDIMLLKLSTEAKLTNNVKTVDLGRADAIDPGPCAVSGWGETAIESQMSFDLMEGSVKLVDGAECAKDKSYCSHGAAKPGKGDSGGPLVCGDGSGEAYGVISRYHGPLKRYYYVKISDYFEWIDSIMKNGSQPAI